MREVDLRLPRDKNSSIVDQAEVSPTSVVKQSATAITVNLIIIPLFCLGGGSGSMPFLEDVS